jgi:hypothetical protein
MRSRPPEETPAAGSFHALPGDPASLGRLENKTVAAKFKSPRERLAHAVWQQVAFDAVNYHGALFVYIVCAEECREAFDRLP